MHLLSEMLTIISLLNLASNAVKFTRQGEVVITVRLLKKAGDIATISFEVIDSGSGIKQVSRLIRGRNAT